MCADLYIADATKMAAPTRMHYGADDFLLGALLGKRKRKGVNSCQNKHRAFVLLFNALHVTIMYIMFALG